MIKGLLPNIGGGQDDLVTTFRCLLDLFGGPAGLARQIKLDFDGNEKGSANRIKLELAMLSIMGNLGDSGGEGAEDEYLDALEKRLLNDVPNGQPA